MRTVNRIRANSYIARTICRSLRKNPDITCLSTGKKTVKGTNTKINSINLGVKRKGKFNRRNYIRKFIYIKLGQSTIRFRTDIFNDHEEVVLADLTVGGSIESEIQTGRVAYCFHHREHKYLLTNSHIVSRAGENYIYPIIWPFYGEIIYCTDLSPSKLLREDVALIECSSSQIYEEFGPELDQKILGIEDFNAKSYNTGEYYILVNNTLLPCSRVEPLLSGHVKKIKYNQYDLRFADYHMVFCQSDLVRKGISGTCVLRKVEGGWKIAGIVFAVATGEYACAFSFSKIFSLLRSQIKELH